jgi:hypothetical protein
VSEAFGHALALYKTKSQRHAAILESWREHPSNAEPWRSLETAASKHGKALPAPADFIGAVLGATMPASRLNDHSRNVRERFEKLKRQLIEAVNDAIYPLDLWRDLARFERHSAIWIGAITICLRQPWAVEKIKMVRATASYSPYECCDILKTLADSRSPKKLQCCSTSSFAMFRTTSGS